MIKIFNKISLALMFIIVVITIKPQNTYANLALSENRMNNPSAWAKEEIDKAKEIDLIPERIQGDYRNNITREEFSELAVSLYEILGGKEIMLEKEKPFTDTQNPKIIMANKLGIVAGKENGIFAPNENITREQVSVVIYRTLQVAKPKYSYSDLYEYKFQDYNFISPWAREAVGYLYGVEVISGVGDDGFNPNGYTSREEAIVLVKRMYDKVLASERASRNGLTVSRSAAVNRQEDSLMAKLKNLVPKELGKPYKWGGIGPNSYDCSGLVYSLFAKLGIELPRTSQSQASAGAYVSKQDLQYGDIVFFARNGKTINHVGIYVGNGEFVHAPQSGDVVKITTLMSGYYANSYYTARRVLPQ
ncbi:hypothetical protein CIW83_01235 [Tissierella sp. P1]|jgi:hypothetical protein|uniref:NlpC/P60 family protein n=1 Tax=Tissierella TaxID=41273 RepID=UPI000BA1672E|nr:NlpC/P60 family protein [Tissierella sp. P1]OZV14075.1 hypothetical protein CIW83_01235 [Tissierella sp. P1]